MDCMEKDAWAQMSLLHALPAHDGGPPMTNLSEHDVTEILRLRALIRGTLVERMSPDGGLNMGQTDATTQRGTSWDQESASSASSDQFGSSPFARPCTPVSRSRPPGVPPLALRRIFQPALDAMPFSGKSSKNSGLPSSTCVPESSRAGASSGSSKCHATSPQCPGPLASTCDAAKGKSGEEYLICHSDKVLGQRGLSKEEVSVRAGLGGA